MVGTNQNGAIAQGDGSADFVAQRQRIWGVGGNYTFGAGMVGLVWSRTQVDNMASVLSFGLGNYVPLGGGGAAPRQL